MGLECETASRSRRPLDKVHAVSRICRVGCDMLLRSFECLA
jgi:hypothetical protein